MAHLALGVIEADVVGVFESGPGLNVFNLALFAQLSETAGQFVHHLILPLAEAD